MGFALIHNSFITKITQVPNQRNQIQQFSSIQVPYQTQFSSIQVSTIYRGFKEDSDQIVLKSEKNQTKNETKKDKLKPEFCTARMNFALP